MQCSHCQAQMAETDDVCPRCQRPLIEFTKKTVVIDVDDEPYSEQPIPYLPQPQGVMATPVYPTPTMASPVVARTPDAVYCPACGRPVHRQAAMCTWCGAQMMPMAPPYAYPAAPLPMVSPRDKWVAVILTFFFGPFGWLYTYQVDGTKFWLNLLASALTCGAWYVIAGFWAFIEALVRGRDFYENYPYGAR